MLATLALVALQAEFLPIDDPTDDDIVVHAVHTADGRSVLLGHVASGTVTRLDLGLGRVVASVPAADSLADLVLHPSGQELLVLDSPFSGGNATLHVLSSPGLAPQTSIPLSITGAWEVLVDGAGATAIVVGGDPVAPSASVVDLAAGVEARVLQLPAVTGTGFSARLRFLADDDRTLVTLAGAPFPGHEVHAIDTATGQTSATVALESGIQQAVLAPSGDRSTFVVPVQRLQPAGTSMIRFDSTTLALQAQTVLLGFIGVQQLELDRTGRRATALRGSATVTFDLVNGGVGVGGPFTVLTSWPAVRFAWSSDRSRLLLLSGFEGDSAIADASGTILSSFDARSIGFAGAIASPVAPSFAVLAPFSSERVSIIDGSGPTPAGVVLDVNTGIGDELDGPLIARTSPDVDEAIVAATDSDTVLRVDLETGALLGRMDVARGPITVAARADGRFLVGHEDGQLLVLDPSGPSELARADVGGAVVAVVPDETGTRAWLRVERVAGDELVRVETAGAAPSVLSRTLLAGRSGPRWIADRSIAIDPVSNTAAAVSPNDGVLESIDLAGPAVVANIAIGTAFGDRRVAIAPGGSRVALSTDGGSPTIEVFDVGPGTIQSNWSFHVSGQPDLDQPNGGVAFVGGGSAVIVDLSAWSPFGGPSGLRAFDATTGSMLDLVESTFGSSMAVVGDDIALARGDQIRTYRWDGNGFVDEEIASVQAPAFAGGRIVLDRERGRAVAVASRLAPAPGTSGLAVVDLFESRTSTLCDSGTPNATGVIAELTLSGSPYAGGTAIATITGLEPNGMTGTLVVGDMATAPTMLPFGVGELCVGGSVGRLVAPPQSADATGAQRYVIDTLALTTSAGSFVVQSGQSWVFQLWHRDVAPNGASSANTSTAVELTFR